MTSKLEAKKRIEKLKEVINHHRYLYHVLDKQELSDAALDSLKKELFDLEQEFPEFMTPDSPTQRIGGEPLKEFQKVEHLDIDGEPLRMNSLNDAFSIEDLESWIERTEKVLGKKMGGMYCDLKMDGLAIELVYENGLLSQASTRGDGVIGEDVTNNIKTVSAIPLKLIGKYPERLVVRGEVFMNKKEFDRINKEQKKKDQKIYANPRNIAAGSIRQLDPKITASRNLSFYAYGVAGESERYLKEYPSHDLEYRALNSYGIPTNPEGKVCKTLQDVIKFFEDIEKKRDKLAYQIDGLVVSINDNKIYHRAGIVGKTPRGAIAYKFSPEEAETIVEDIVVQVGRTGSLTPVAVLKPVEIGGVTVSRATLHNLDEIRRLDVRIGDTVIVGRAGDVIPDIREVIKGLRTGKEKEFHMPKKCPICGEKVEKIPGQVAYKCSNKDCPAIKREGIYHFVSKGGFNIDGVGPKIIDQLMEAALIRDAADLFYLKEEDLLNLPRFAEKSAQNTIKSIQGNKEVPLNKFIYSLGIHNVGIETATDLARKFRSIDKLSDASEEELNNVKDIGSVVAQSIKDWFSHKYNQNLLVKLEKAGVKPIVEKETKDSKKLEGKTFVFTGSIEKMSREAAEEKVRSLGGDTSSSVSSNTDYLVAGSEPGSKYEKAKKLNVKIITEEEFLKIIK